MNNQDIIDSIDLEDFSSYPTIELESINEISTINNIVNDPNLPDYVFVPGNYLRLYIRGREPNVAIYEIKKCLRYIGTINTEQQFNPPETLQLHNQVTPMTIDTIDSPIYEPNSPYTPPFAPESPPPLSVTTIEGDSPNSISSTGTLIGGKKKKSRKVKNKKRNKNKKKTRKGGSDKRLPLGITDENENELFVTVVKDKKGKLAYSEDANIFATIRSDGVPPIYSPKMKDFDTIAFQNRGKSKNNKTKKKSN